MNDYKTTIDSADAQDQEKESIEKLNHLTEICKDGEKGFKEAADGLEGNSELQTLCLQYSRERGQFARELQYEVRLLNGDPVSSGTIAGALHRGWIDIKAAVTAKDEDAIVAECERGEDAAKEAYEKTLMDYLLPQATELVKRQYKKVLQSHDRFSALKKTAR
jgi:uncharacterized protein (TIGR02284 family)